MHINNNVYITGAGIISAIGNNISEVKDSILSGKSGIKQLCYLKSQHKELPCGEVPLSNDEMLKMLGLPQDNLYNRTVLLGINAIKQIFEQAVLNKKDDLWLISGTTVGGMDQTERHFLDMMENDDYLNLLSLHSSDSSTRYMADYFGIPVKHTVTVSTACSSALNSIIVGANMIKNGIADMVIAGGSEALSLFHLNGFNTLMILDHERCRPFDNTRKGLNLGEGAAFVLLESKASVMRRGVSPMAMVSGYGNKCDAFHQTATSSDGEGAYLAMKEALETAGISPADIGYVNAHGTGTPNNDECESVALKRIFGDSMPRVSSTKSYTGHATSAAGGIETVISLSALTDGYIPGNLGWQNSMPNGIVPSSGMSGVRLRHVMCNSFGFGGNDSSLILSQADYDNANEIIPNSLDSFEIESHAAVRSTPSLPVGNFRDFIAPMEARRLCPLLKTSITVSMTALKQAGIECPDAIIVGTTYGMLENSEKFLLQLCKTGEHGLSPTLFMHSTHNTIAGVLAVKLGCHGYNITYIGETEEQVLDLCKRDAKMLMQQGKIKNALIGYHNEITPVLHDMIMRLRGEDLQVGITSSAIVLTKK